MRPTDMLTGYCHPDYAASFSHVGTPFLLPASQGWLIERPIPGTMRQDAMGCYPLFRCEDWRALAADLDALADRLVSVVLVPDPFGHHTPALLESTFDKVVPFKDHFVIETGQPPEQFVRPSHRARARRALKEVAVNVVFNPTEYIDEWERLYGILAARHAINGLRRFSREAFQYQLALPGLVMFRASVLSETIGLDLWVSHGDSVYNHLPAFDEKGYALGASYAMKWFAIEHFGTSVRWINLGGGASKDPRDGLARFKRGWSNSIRTTSLCGRVLQPGPYADIVRTTATSDGAYFPAYRAGEFS